MPKVEIKVEMDSEAPGYGPTAVEIRLDGADIGGGGIGGESEDNCIVRDYAWVVPALKALAERLGAEVEIVKTVSDDDARPRCDRAARAGGGDGHSVARVVGGAGVLARPGIPEGVDMKTYQQEIGDLVTLALSPPEVPSMAAGSATHDRLLNAWQANVRGSARALWHRVLGVDPRAVRICEMILTEFGEV